MNTTPQHTLCVALLARHIFHIPVLSRGAFIADSARQCSTVRHTSTPSKFGECCVVPAVQSMMIISRRAASADASLTSWRARTSDLVRRLCDDAPRRPHTARDAALLLSWPPCRGLPPAVSLPWLTLPLAERYCRLRRGPRHHRPSYPLAASLSSSFW